MKIIALVQARMTSTRLPGKVMLPLLNKSLLVRMVERVEKARLIHEVIVATSTVEEDDHIEQECIQNNVSFFRGDPLDLLDRHYKAACESDADIVLKIPSDCPLIDPSIIDQVISFYLESSHFYDYVSNLHPATFPDGNDVELMTFYALEKSWFEATRQMEREHTTPYMWEHPVKFRVGNVLWKSGLDYSMSHRWTIDYKEDYLLIKEIFETLYKTKPNFTLEDILELLERKPRLNEINRKFVGVNWYRDHLNELKTVGADQTRQLI